ncbi:MAG: hypothetical protein HUJ63_04480, partial [Enterococcus sp.]|nr:hypothetical protein [Enterococcus sp.]
MSYHILSPNNEWPIPIMEYDAKVELMNTFKKTNPSFSLTMEDIFKSEAENADKEITELSMLAGKGDVGALAKLEEIKKALESNIKADNELALKVFSYLLVQLQIGSQPNVQASEQQVNKASESPKAVSETLAPEASVPQSNTQVNVVSSPPKQASAVAAQENQQQPIGQQSEPVVAKRPIAIETNSDEIPKDAPIPYSWETSYPLSILGCFCFVGYFVLTGFLPSEIAAPLWAGFLIVCCVYNMVVYPKFFGKRTNKMSNSLVSFLNCLFGCFIFGPIFNSNIKNKKI